MKLIAYSQFLQWGTLLVAQLVAALRYKQKCCGFGCRLCRWNFSLT
jgi:hypothetical protein